MVLNGLEKRLHLRRLIDDVVREEEAAGVEARVHAVEEASGWQRRVHDVEEAFVVRLPRVEEHQIEGALKLWNLLERVSVNDAHDIRQSRLLNVCGGFLCALALGLHRDERRTRLT